MSAPLPEPRSLHSGPSTDLLGSTTPRLWTPPLRDLCPKTSYGFGVVDFARDVLGTPLDPWQEWLVVHMGELLQDGRPRFRQVLVLVARQNGKTHLSKVLTLWWLFVEQWPLVLSTSTNLAYARESWEEVVAYAEGSSTLSTMVPRSGVRRANGEQRLKTTDGCRYQIAASNRKGGRSLSIDRLVLDELREHHSWDAWNAAVPAMNARPAAQLLAITNQGDEQGVVLDSLRRDALDYLENGSTGDERLGLFEWSAPDGADPLDEQAWCSSNPNLGRRLDVDTVRSAAKRAKAHGGEEESGFRTEVLCQRVRTLNAAVDPGAWQMCSDPGTLDGARGRVVLALDVAPDELHASLVAAGMLADGRVRVEVVKAWSGLDATGQVRAELPALLKRVKPQVLVWLPSGPAASLAVWLRTIRPPCRIEEIKGDVPAVCMGLAEQVRTYALAHSDDPLLDAHVKGSARLRYGDRWVFSRVVGHCDAAYATAAAVHAARAYPALTTKHVVTVPRG